MSDTGPATTAAAEKQEVGLNCTTYLGQKISLADSRSGLLYRRCQHVDSDPFHADLIAARAASCEFSQRNSHLVSTTYLQLWHSMSKNFLVIDKMSNHSAGPAGRMHELPHSTIRIEARQPAGHAAQPQKRTLTARILRFFIYITFFLLLIGFIAKAGHRWTDRAFDDVANSTTIQTQDATFANATLPPWLAHGTQSQSGNRSNIFPKPVFGSKTWADSVTERFIPSNDCQTGADCHPSRGQNAGARWLPHVVSEHASVVLLWITQPIKQVWYAWREARRARYRRAKNLPSLKLVCEDDEVDKVLSEDYLDLSHGFPSQRGQQQLKRARKNNMKRAPLEDARESQKPLLRASSNQPNLAALASTAAVNSLDLNTRLIAIARALSSPLVTKSDSASFFANG